MTNRCRGNEASSELVGAVTQRRSRRIPTIERNSLWVTTLVLARLRLTGPSPRLRYLSCGIVLTGIALTGICPGLGCPGLGYLDLGCPPGDVSELPRAEDSAGGSVQGMGS